MSLKNVVDGYKLVDGYKKSLIKELKHLKNGKAHLAQTRSMFVIPILERDWTEMAWESQQATVNHCEPRDLAKCLHILSLPKQNLLMPSKHFWIMFYRLMCWKWNFFERHGSDRKLTWLWNSIPQPTVKHAGDGVGWCFRVRAACHNWLNHELCSPTEIPVGQCSAISAWSEVQMQWTYGARWQFQTQEQVHLWMTLIGYMTPS